MEKTDAINIIIQTIRCVVYVVDVTRLHTLASKSTFAFLIERLRDSEFLHRHVINIKIIIIFQM